MSMGHPYLGFAIPENAPFRLQPASPGKGWGAFATREIRRGEEILREKPYFVIRKPHAQITEEDVRTAFAGLTPAQKQMFLRIRDNGHGRFARMASVLAENSFNIGPEGGAPAYGLFVLQSRFNHSCVPNSNLPLNETASDNALVRLATRDIQAGEEITFCYNTDFSCRTRQERHEELYFACLCECCGLRDPAEQQASDMRRRLCRGLHYLLNGVDLDAQKQVSGRPIIFDPKRRQDAETLSTGLSMRLIAGVMICWVLEQEGVMDEVVDERMRPVLIVLPFMFKTKEYAQTAQRALAQKTWAQKLAVALQLYEKVDEAETEVIGPVC